VLIRACFMAADVDGPDAKSLACLRRLVSTSTRQVSLSDP
jgi:hypothetical protein